MRRKKTMGITDVLLVALYLADEEEGSGNLWRQAPDARETLPRLNLLCSRFTFGWGFATLVGNRT